MRFAALALVSVAILIPARGAACGKSDDAYVLFLDKNSVSMSGDLEDLAEARSVRKKSGGSTLWFRQAGTEYVVTDPDVVRAFAAIQNVEGEDDERQDRLDREMEELDDRLEELSDQKDDLEDRAEDPDTLERAMAGMERQIEAVAAKIDRLSARQDELGRELERAADETDHRMRELLEQAVASGAARAVPSSKP